MRFGSAGSDWLVTKSTRQQSFLQKTRQAGGEETNGRTELDTEQRQKMRSDREEQQVLESGF